jgi:hypothetical protein
MSNKGSNHMNKALKGLMIVLFLSLTASIIIAEPAAFDSKPLLIATALAPLNISPLANLDLIPPFVKESRSSKFADLNLEPRNMSADANASVSEPLLGLTALAPLNISQLAKLDLIPRPVAASRPSGLASGSAHLNLDPRSVVANYGPRYFGPDTRVHSIGDRLYDVSLFSIVALNIADYLSTREALKYPCLHEGNPLMKSIVKSPVAFAAVKIGFAAVSYFSMKSLYKINKTLGWVVSMATNFAMSYVVSNNMRLINQARRR